MLQQINSEYSNDDRPDGDCLVLIVGGGILAIQGLNPSLYFETKSTTHTMNNSAMALLTNIVGFGDFRLIVSKTG